MKVTDLLTDEFVVFSKKIEKIFEEKKAKKMELKAFYEKINVDLKALDDEAQAAQVEFEKGGVVVPSPPVVPDSVPTPEPTTKGIRSK